LFASLLWRGPVDPRSPALGEIRYGRRVKLYAFDGITEALDLVPLAARRALDLAGLKLSREGWSSLSHEARIELVELGAHERVDTRRVAAICERASPRPESLAVAPDPDPTTPSAEVVTVFAPLGAIATRWAALSTLDRYALAKVAQRPRPERVAAAWAEIVGA